MTTMEINANDNARLNVLEYAFTIPRPLVPSQISLSVPGGLAAWSAQPLRCTLQLLLASLGMRKLDVVGVSPSLAERITTTTSI